MASSFLKEALVGLQDWYDSPGSLNYHKRVTDPLERQQYLAYLECPGLRHAFYKTARTLRKEWGLPLEPDTQTAITEFFIEVNTSHWERVVRGQEQVLDFLRSGAKDALGEVAENLHQQWEQGQPVVEELLGGYRGIPGGGLIDALAGIMGTVGIRIDHSQNGKIARLLDPYFEQSKALEIGMQLCQEQGIPIEEGVSWGTKWGFIKRNTIDLSREGDPIRRGEIFKWLNDDTRVDQALQRLTADLSFNYSVVAIKKLC